MCVCIKSFESQVPACVGRVHCADMVGPQMCHMIGSAPFAELLLGSRPEPWLEDCA